MSSELDKEIEENVVSILTEVIASRNGETFKDSVTLITFVAIICTNAAKLEHVDYKKLPLDEQVNIAMIVIPEVYNALKLANLITADVDSLKEKVKASIAIYDLTAQITGLPSFNDVSKAGIGAIKKSGIKLPKIKIGKFKL